MLKKIARVSPEDIFDDKHIEPIKGMLSDAGYILVGSENSNNFDILINEKEPEKIEGGKLVYFAIDSDADLWTKELGEKALRLSDKGIGELMTCIFKLRDDEGYRYEGDDPAVKALFDEVVDRHGRFTGDPIEFQIALEDLDG